MTLPSHAELKLKVQAATKGPWKCRKSIHGNKYRYVQFDKGPTETAMYTTSELEPADAAFIAAANPTTVLALLARDDEMQERVNAADAIIKGLLAEIEELKGTDAEYNVCQEIIDIMRVYDEQVAKNGYPDTPGGLEHMGDVWGLLSGWCEAIRAGHAGGEDV